MTYYCKYLVIGDLHLEDPYNGYLEAQLRALRGIIESSSARKIIFLGDIFHHRNPAVKVLVKTKEFFDKISAQYFNTEFYLLRGNHDSASKADDNLTVLDVLRSSKIQVIKESSFIDEHLGFIPHYENELKVIHDLSSVNNCPIIFGHFGYEGCINTGQYFNFKVKKSDLKGPQVILGHIHRYAKDDNITILGTPWPTNFGECDYQHYVLEFELVDGVIQNLTPIEVKFGPRYYACPLHSLEQMKDEIMDPNYYTVLRVIMDRFSDEHTNELRSKILKDYNVAYVDLKFQPILDKKLNNRISNYEPTTKLESLGEEVITKYIEENATTIPKEILLKGLEEIKLHEDNEDIG